MAAAVTELCRAIEAILAGVAGSVFRCLQVGSQLAPLALFAGEDPLHLGNVAGNLRV